MSHVGLQQICPMHNSLQQRASHHSVGAGPHKATMPLLLRHCCTHCRSERVAPPCASVVTSVAETATLAAAVGGLALSALPLLTGEAAERNAERTVNAETSEEDFVFGVISAVSFLPYVNWTVGSSPILTITQCNLPAFCPCQLDGRADVSVPLLETCIGSSLQLQCLQHHQQQHSDHAASDKAPTEESPFQRAGVGVQGNE